MPHSTRLPDTPCSPHRGETSQLSSTRASSAAEVSNDLGELPWRLEGREHCEGMLDLMPDLPPSGDVKNPPLSMRDWGCPAIVLSTGGASHQEATRDVFGGPLMLKIWLVPPSIPRMHLIDERVEQESLVAESRVYHSRGPSASSGKRSLRSQDDSSTPAQSRQGPSSTLF